MPACFDLLNTGRPLLPPTLGFVNSNLHCNPFEIKGLQLYENILLQNSNILKACQAALLALYFHGAWLWNPWLVPSTFLMWVAVPGDSWGNLWDDAKISCSANLRVWHHLLCSLCHCGCTRPAQPVTFFFQGRVKFLKFYLLFQEPGKYSF